MLLDGAACPNPLAVFVVGLAVGLIGVLVVGAASVGGMTGGGTASGAQAGALADAIADALTTPRSMLR